MAGMEVLEQGGKESQTDRGTDEGGQCSEQSQEVQTENAGVFP